MSVEQLAERFVMRTYAPRPALFVRAEGCELFDAAGRAHLDFVSGIGVCNTGHCHPAVVAAVREQAGRLIHASNLYWTEPGVRLAERLVESSLGGRAFLCNSGAEANEAAIKLVRKRAVAQRGAERAARGRVVVMEGAFHGRTMGALAATPQEQKQAPFAPMLAGFQTVPRDDLSALDAAVGEDTIAVLLEPVQGEGGIWPLSAETLRTARAACDRAGAALVFDEVQCGMGRTGTLWAYEGYGVRPDALTCAKALGGGLPVGALVTTPELADVLEPGDHGTTFGGSPLTAAAALAAFDVLDDEGLLAHVRAMGERLEAGLAELEDAGKVTGARGRGLMRAADLPRGGAAEVVSAALGERILLNATGPATIRFLPPLVVSEEQVDRVLRFLGQQL